MILGSNYFIETNNYAKFRFYSDLYSDTPTLLISRICSFGKTLAITNLKYWRPSYGDYSQRM